MENNKYTEDELALFNEEGIDINTLENDITDDNSQNESRPDINEDLPTAEEDNPENNADVEVPVDNEPQKETTPLIGGKFKSYDDLLKDYNELERHSGNQASQINELRKQVGGENPDNMPVPERITQEDMFGNVTDEQLSELIISHPKEFISQMMNVLKSDVQSTVSKESTVNKYLDEFFSGNSDISEYSEEFKNLCSELNNPQYALEVIRGRKAGNLDELMANEEYVKKNLNGGKLDSFLNDESIYEKLGDKVKQKIIDDYVKNVKASKSNVSPLNSDTGYASKVPPKTYADFNEMRDDSINFLKELENNEN